MAIKKTLQSTEDADLFKKTVGNVKAVNSDKVMLAPSNKPKPFPQPKSPVNTPSFEQTVSRDSDILYQEDSIRFIAPGLQKNVLKKLRKGFFGLDASIDLHGLTRRQANVQLACFIQNSIEAGCRCIHIIHGKGYHSLNNQPVLKNNINGWLRQHKAVQAFCSAPSKEGGVGAVFVLLKRSQKYGKKEAEQY